MKCKKRNSDDEDEAKQIVEMCARIYCNVTAIGSDVRDIWGIMGETLHEYLHSWCLQREETW